MEHRFFLELKTERIRTLLVLEFYYQNDTDWYELKVYHGSNLIGYLHGYANSGWNPQVNNVWVAEPYRRRRIATSMMERVEAFFGETPKPATPIQDNEAARNFWKKFMK